jgi:hypothetical protein
MMRRHLAACLLACSGLLGCREQRTEDAPAPKTEPGLVTRAVRTQSPIIDLLDLAGDCDLDHQGLVLELGEKGSEAQGSFSFRAPPAWPRVTHGGTTYARIDQRQASFDFWVGSPLTISALSALVLPGGTDRAVVAIDEQRIATLRPNAAPEVTRVKIREQTLAPGPHRLTLSLPRRTDAARTFDVSWIRLGTPSADDSDLPPARRDILREVDIGGDQRPAVVLRSGSAWRCAVWVPEGARVHTEIGLWGSGSGGAELAAVSSGQRAVLSSYVLDSKEEKPAWRSVELDLSAYAGQAVELELRATGVTSGTRLAFAGPRLILKDAVQSPIPRAKRAIVITLSGLLREHRPSSFAEHGLPSLAALARSATFYPEYRNPTTSVLGVMASLLTGLEPWQHGVAEDTDRLPTSCPTLAETLAASGGQAGLFTGVPLSFEGFGLGRGFERYVSISPTEDRAATDPIDEAQAWLSSHQADDGPVLAVLHLRGGHPPFDIDKDRARALPPKEYGGDLDARRAAIQLGDIRARRPIARQQMPEEDWQRLESLRRAALLDLDARLARFFTWLSATFADDSTLLVVVGDIPAGERPHIPYEDGASLSEEYLRTLLLIHHPGGHLSARAIPGLFTTTDLSHTLARSLEVETTAGSNFAVDLAHAGATTLATRRVQIAYRAGAYSALLGPMRLLGKDGQLPALCDISLDPSCLENRRERELTLLRTMWAAARRRIAPELERRAAPETRDPDERLDSALAAWGLER